MGSGIDATELRRRAIEGVREEVVAFGSGAPDSRVGRQDGLTVSIAPAAPHRSLFNSVYYEDPAALMREYDSLAASFERAGVRAWTVWVPDEDRETGPLLAERGHLLDAAPRAMAMGLDAPIDATVRPAGIELGPIEPSEAAVLNDRAYGYEEEGFRAGLAGETSIRWFGAHAGGEPVCCVGTIAVGDDCCVTGVATPPEHRGRGIAGWLLLTALADARERDATTASLQATKAGAPLYERLGFRDFGFVEMWELRR